MGHHVAQIGICITDSVDDVSHYARVAISCLYELLLCQMGKQAGEDEAHFGRPCAIPVAHMHLS